MGVGGTFAGVIVICCANEACGVVICGQMFYPY